jgi:tripartite-type tricarboxylate transporter receptor subunit TctC
MEFAPAAAPRRRLSCRAQGGHSPRKTHQETTLTLHDPSRRRFGATLAGAAALAALAPTLAGAQAGFPSKPIRIVVPFAAGGPTDLMARAIAKPMQASLGQPVVVENKPGGGGVIGLTELARSPADGHTLAFPSILAVTNPALMPDYPFDTLRDFTPLTVVGFIPHAVVVRPDFPARSLQELVAMAKAKPGTLAYGSSGNGTSAHLGAALFAQRAGIQVTHVPYRGAGPALR